MGQDTHEDGDGLEAPPALAELAGHCGGLTIY